MSKYPRYIFLLLLVLSFVTQASTFATKPGEKVTSDVRGRFSPGGRVLTITSQAEYEELWALQVHYCDGTAEDLNRHNYKLRIRTPLSGTSYTFYAEKPMKRVVVVSLPIEGPNAAASLYRTEVWRNCETSGTPPKLYCSNVQTSGEIQRLWEGVPVSFKSNRHVIFTGLKFPGVDGLAPARIAQLGPNKYQPSVNFHSSNNTWTGTFISQRIPPGEYQKVMLVVRDDFGQQAKCPVGNVTVLR